MRYMSVYIPIIVGIILTLLWAFQLVQLMLLEDSDFPGRHDKILWVVIFIVLFFLAPLLFMAWKSGYKHYRQNP